MNGQERILAGDGVKCGIRGEVAGQLAEDGWRSATKWYPWRSGRGKRGGGGRA